MAALILFASCSAKETAGTKAADTPAQSETADEATRTGKTNFSDMTVGKIESIVGNQVTLALGEIDKDAMPERPSGEMPKKDGDSSDSNTRPDGKMPPEEFTMPEGFSAPEGFSMPEGKSFPEGMSRPDFSNGGSFDKQFGGMDIDVKYTGETAQFVIPSEVQVGNGDYTSLSKGMVIGITLDENNVVSTVRILSREAK